MAPYMVSGWIWTPAEGAGLLGISRRLAVNGGVRRRRRSLIGKRQVAGRLRVGVLPSVNELKVNTSRDGQEVRCRRRCRGGFRGKIGLRQVGVPHGVPRWGIGQTVAVGEAGARTGGVGMVRGGGLAGSGVRRRRRASAGDRDQ